MPRAWIERIRETVRLQQYDMTVHAVEEMAEDGLDIDDMEHAVLAGRVVRVERNDPRGNKHVIRATTHLPRATNNESRTTILEGR